MSEGFKFGDELYLAQLEYDIYNQTMWLVQVYYISVYIYY